MRRAALAVLVTLLASLPNWASPEAVLGSLFADAYAAFAPLGEVYRSLASHLFAGEPIWVPVGVETSCEAYQGELGKVQAQIVLGPAADVETLAAVVRLRLGTEGFCAEFEADLAYLGDLAVRTQAPADGDEERLVAARFFARIHDLDLAFSEALGAALASVDGEARWAMAIGFSMRSILGVRDPIRWPARGDLMTLFYGSETGTAPRFSVPEPVSLAMADLVSLAGRDRREDETARARQSAVRIYEHFIAR